MKKIIIIFLLIIPICVFSNEFALYYTVHDSLQIGFFGAPYVSYTSDSSFSLGFSLLIFEKNLAEKILAGQDFNVRVDIRYSYEEEREFFIDSRIPIRNFYQNIYLKLEYKTAPRIFYGIGGNTTKDDAINYQREQYRFLGDWTRIISKRMSAGVAWDFSGYENEDIDKREERNIFNDSGNTAENFYDFYRAIGFGPTFIYNTRLPNNFPLMGSYYKNVVLFYHKNLGSEYNFITLNQEFQYFYRLKSSLFQKNDHVIASQLISNNTFGDTPFHYLPDQGSGNMMRGFSSGRFVDEQYLSVQSEYRSPFLFWRVSSVAFCAAGISYAGIHDFVSGNINLTGGFGLRFALDKQQRVNVRADAGFSKEGYQIYLKFGDAF